MVAFHSTSSTGVVPGLGRADPEWSKENWILIDYSRKRTTRKNIADKYGPFNYVQAVINSCY